LIVSILDFNDDVDKKEDIKSALEEKLNVQATVFINERASVIENKIKDCQEGANFFVKIDILDDDNAEAMFYKKNGILMSFEEEDSSEYSEVVSTVKNVIEDIYKKNLIIEKEVQDNTIVINIQTSDEPGSIAKGQAFRQIITDILKDKTGTKTRTFVNDPSILTIVDDLVNVILINVDIDRNISYDGKLTYGNQNFEQLSASKKKYVIPIVLTLQKEIDEFNAKLEDNSSTEASLIVSIDLTNIEFPNEKEKAKVHQTVIAQLKIFIKQNLGFRNFVLIDRPETFIRNLLESLDNYYYIPVKVTPKNRIIRGDTVNRLVEPLSFPSEFIDVVDEAVKEVLHWEYFSNEYEITTSNIATESSLITTNREATTKATAGNLPEVTTRYYKASQSYDRIIKILADLFIRTLDLSFRIKGAMDKNSKSGDNVEFQIVSRNEDTRKNDFVPGDGNDSEIFSIPEIIKITPFDAMYVHNNQSDIPNVTNKKPVIIDIENDQNINFNVSNGMVFEIDLSNLPTDEADRETEIRLRVRNFIDGIRATEDVSPMKIMERIDNDSLSDAIIRNITQIVLIQMDEALKNKPEENITKQNEIKNFLQIASKNERVTFRPSTESVVDEFSKDSVTIGFPTSTSGPTTSADEMKDLIPNIQQATPPILEDFEQESNQVINEVKNTISGIIKDVLSAQDKSDVTADDFDNIVKEIKEKVPTDVKLKTTQIDERELQEKIKETVGKILTEEEIKSVVLLRNITSTENSALETDSAYQSRNNVIFSTTLSDIASTSTEEEQFLDNVKTVSSSDPAITTESSYTIAAATQAADEREYTFAVLETTETFLDAEVDEAENEFLEVKSKSVTTSTLGEQPGLVINLKPFSEFAENREKVSDSGQAIDEVWRVILNASQADNELIETSEVFISPSPAQTNEVQNIIQDGSLFADTSNSGVVKAKVVEDTSFARSIRPPNVGIAAIISIVIGILALLCFSLMIFLAMARRRRQMEEMAPSTTAYTSTSRYTPEGTSSNISDMKATYIDELSPNVSSSDLQTQDVVIPMDGHQTIIGSYEDFLDVPTGARPNILQSLPISPTTYTENVPRTHEMTDPELAFTPRFKNNN